MSAFMVEDKTINYIVSFLYMNRNDLGYELMEKLKENDFDIEHFDNIDKLAIAMFKLNEEGVNERYGDNEAGKFRPLNFKFEFNSQATNKHQVLKSLRCWLYQCSEGDVPSHPVYIIGEEMSKWLCYNIATNSEEYDNANWC